MERQQCSFEPSMNYMPRLVSIILDPISFGHIITAAFVSLFFLKSIKKQEKKAVSLYIDCRFISNNV